MTERPILFSGAMVRAILDGRKTQTRRVVKPVRGFERHNVCKPDMAADAWAVWWHGDETDRVGCIQECPSGQPGDRLWVRETFEHIWTDSVRDWHYVYAADGIPSYLPKGERMKWRPSIFMPRNASRIALEVTGVRVERVQAITEADAKAEGVARESDPDDCTADDAELNAECGYFPPRSYVDGYRNLWNSLNAKRGFGWDVNPWVWVIDFRRSAPPLTGTPNE